MKKQSEQIAELSDLISEELKYRSADELIQMLIDCKGFDKWEYVKEYLIHTSYAQKKGKFVKAIV